MSHDIERGPYGAQLSLQASEGSQIFPYQLEILMADRPEGLLPVFRQASAKGARFVCPVTGLVTLTERMKEKRLTRRQAEAILQEAARLVSELPDYLLNAEQLLLHPDWLFLRPQELRIQVVYQPFLPVSDVFSERHLAEWLGEAICRSHLMRRFWEKRCQAILSEPMSEPIPSRSDLHSSDPHSLDSPSLVSLWVRLLAGVQAVAFLLTVVPLLWPGRTSDFFSSVKIPLLVLLLITIPIQLFFLSKGSSWHTGLTRFKEKWTEKRNKNQVSLPAAEGRQSVLDALLSKVRAEFKHKAWSGTADPVVIREQPTELLSSKQATFRLATLSEGMIGTAAELAGQRAFILTEDFLIGRDSRLVDFCLTGHAVGRSHARITRKGATFFLMDLGSKNGTRLNGECLNKLVDYRLPDRCQVQFADRLFYFEAEELAGQNPIVTEP